MAKAEDSLGPRPSEHLADVAGPEPLARARDSRQNLLCNLRGVEVFLTIGFRRLVDATRLEADVTGTAVFRVLLFTKVGQQIAPAARLQLAELHHLGQLPAGVLSFYRVLDLLDEELVLYLVGPRVEEYAVAGQIVAAGPARLLVVPLDGLGHIVVDDETDIGLVDAHPEGDGGHND